MTIDHGSAAAQEAAHAATVRGAEAGDTQAEAPGAAQSTAPARRWRRRLPFVAVALVVLLAGFDPHPLPELFPQQDKLHHLFGFAALLFTARVAFPRVPGTWLAAATLAAALAIEIGQGLLLPERSASLGDMLANTAGVLLGWACAHLAQRLRPTA
jgi:VanZ family protein